MLNAIHSNICEINRLVCAIEEKSGKDSQNEGLSSYALNVDDQPKLLELLEKALEFIRIYPDLLSLLNSGKDIPANLEKVLDDEQ